MDRQPAPHLLNLQRRVFQIFWLATSIILSYFIFSITSFVFPREKRLRWKEKLHYKNALRLKDTTLALKGLLIKIGQFMSARVDILPDAYIEVLSQLQDQVPPSPFPEIRERIIRELGEAPETLFETFDEIPIASASLGQVHEATLKCDPDSEETSGKRVAVKVQYPYIDTLVQTDLKALRTISWVLQKIFKNIRFDILYKEFSRIVHYELNYITEGRQAEQFEKNFSDDDRIVVPKVIWRYTTYHVLTLEFMEGIKISQLDQIKTAGIDLEKVATLLTESYMRQILQHRFFHGDPHPGNLFVQPGPRLVYVDFGLMQTISPEMHRGMQKMIMAIIDREVPAIAQGLLDLGFIVRSEQINDIEKAVYFFMDRYRDLPPRAFKQITITQIAEDLGTLFKVYPSLQIPNHFILVGRTAGMLNGLCAQLAPGLNIIELAKPHAKHFAVPDDWAKDFFIKGKDVLSALSELPVILRDFLEYANRGSIKTEMHSDDLTGILTKIYRLAYRTILVATIAGTAFIYHNMVHDMKSPEGILLGAVIMISSFMFIYSLVKRR